MEEIGLKKYDHYTYNLNDGDQSKVKLLGIYGRKSINFDKKNPF